MFLLNDKKRVSLTIIFLIIIFLSTVVFSEDDTKRSEIDTDSFIDKQLENLNLDELQNILEDISNNSDNEFNKIDIKKYVSSLIKGEQIISADDILEGILKSVFKEFSNNLNLLIQLLVLSIICALLTNLHSSFEKDTVGQLAFYVCYIIIISIIIKSFIGAMNVGATTIDRMVDFMQALFPLLITLLALMGGITSSALLQPIIVSSLNAVGAIIQNIVLPLIFFSTIIAIVNNLSNKMQISKLAGLLKQIVVVTLGISFTVFIGIMSIHGAAASKLDGVSIRTAKFAIDNFIPIVGKFLSDSVDTVIGYSMVLKNAVGLVGLLALFTICIIPAIKITSLIFLYKIIGAVIEPIADEKIVNCLNEISKSLILILAAVLSVVLMFFITTTIIIGTGNATVMMR